MHFQKQQSIILQNRVNDALIFCQLFLSVMHKPPKFRESTNFKISSVIAIYPAILALDTNW